MTPKLYTPDTTPADGDWLADVPNAVYHGHPALGASTIVTAVERTAAHAMADRDDDSDTKDTALGTVIHCGVLEPASFNDRYIVKPEGFDGRTKEGKAWLAVHSGREPISADDAAAVVGIRANLAKHPLANDLLTACTHRETSYWTMWKDPESGLAAPIKVRPDAMKFGRAPIVVDLKKSRNGGPVAWPKQVAEYGYHIKAAHYCDCIADLCCTTPDAVQFVWLVVEDKPPYGVATYPLTPRMLEEGLRLRNIGIRRMLDFIPDAPVYSTGLIEFDLPDWYYRKMENVIR